MYNRLKELFLGMVLLIGCNVFSMSYQKSLEFIGNSPSGLWQPYDNAKMINYFHSEELLVKLNDLKFKQRYEMPILLNSEKNLLCQKYYTGTDAERIEAYTRLSESVGYWL